MKKIALILLALLLIGCGNGGGIASVDYSSEGVSSSIDVSSSDVYSSSETPLSSDIVVSSSSSEDIVSSSSITILSSSIVISSSSIISSSSSSFKISSSSSNQIVSSSSLASSSSLEISSSSSLSSSSEAISSSSAYNSTLFLFNADSAQGLEFYVSHNGESSPMYEIISNKIKSYLTYYNWHTLPMGNTYVGDIWILKSGITDTVGMIRDNISTNQETITVRKDDNILQLHRIQNGVATVLFRSSNEINVAGKRTFVLQRTTSNEYICNWYDVIQSKWISAGFSNAITGNPFTAGVCSSLSNYVFN